MSKLEKFIEKSREIHIDKYDYSLVEYINNKTKVKIICNTHGVFESKPNWILSGRGCAKCGVISSGLKRKNLNWKDDFIKIHGNKYDYSKAVYVNNRVKIEIICPEHGSFFMNPNSHKTQGQGCRKCGFFKVTNLIEFITESNKVHKDRYSYLNTVYESSHKKVEVLCNNHGPFTIRPNDHTSGQGCPKCGKERMSDKHRKGLDIFLGECKKINGNFYDYSMVVYKNNKSVIDIICPNHGVFSQSPKQHLRGDGCPKCNSSKGERKIINILESSNVEFIFQHSFENCVSNKNVVLKFDFYLPKYNTCIEYDGEQHFRSIDYFGGESSFIVTKERDEIKNNYCLENKIKLIRIPYNRFDDIEEILIQENNI